MAIINFRKKAASGVGGGTFNRRANCPTDGTFKDGFFQWDCGPSSGVLIEDALDDINELLTLFAPAEGYLLSAIDGSPSYNFSGTSFSSTPRVVGSPGNPLNGVSYAAGDTNGGSRSDFSNDRNFTITTPEINTGDGAVGWRDADQGLFYLDINGSGAGIVDLGGIFSEAERATGQTITAAHASGALSITSVQPTNSFPGFQDGTAVGTFNSTRIRTGYNTFFMSHEGEDAQTRSMWYTPTTSPTVSSGNINAAGAGGNEPDSGISYKYLSGIRFYSAGTFNNLGCQIAGIYGSTYGLQDLTTSSAALTTFSANAPLPVVSAGVVTNPIHVVTGQTVSYRSNIRVLLGGSVSFTFQSRNNYGGNGGSDVDSFTNVLVDTVSASPTDTSEPFDNESRRLVPSGHNDDAYFNDLSITPNWDSTQSIADTAASGYNSSLQVYGGQLCYPSDDFTTITAPASNPDYSSATGRRTYIRVFNTAAGRQNFSLLLNGIAAANLSAVGGGGIWVEMLLPTQTQDGGGNVEWKDTLTAYTTDAGVGALEGSFPTGSNASWDFTAGTKSTANSGGQVVIRLSFPDGETDKCNSMTFTFRS